MPTKYTCSVCGKISDERQCPEHRREGSGWSGRDRAAQAKFRTAVLIRDGHKCRRCGATDNLRACHWPIPLRSFAPDDPDAYNPRHGITLCPECDRALDPYAH